MRPGSWPCPAWPGTIPRVTRTATLINRWLPLALALLWSLLAVGAAIDHSAARAVFYAVAAAGFGCFAAAQLRAPRPAPPHTDDEWARGVLAAAGEPRGVAAVKALRVAEPALSLVDAKELADRVAR